MSISIVLEALNNLDEVNFAFEVQFLLVASWKDERINTVCNGAGAFGRAIPPTDRCAHYWTPELPPTFPNQVSMDGNMAIEVLEDLGLFTVPGRYRIECNSPEVDCTSPINTSMAYRMMRLRGSFGVTGRHSNPIPTDLQVWLIMRLLRAVPGRDGVSQIPL